MKKNFKQYIKYTFALMIAVIAVAALTACSSAASTTTQAAASTPATTASTPTTPATVSTPPATDLLQRQGTMGTLDSINGNTLMLTDAQGNQVTINIDDTTTIQKTVTGTIADLQQGDFLTVTGEADASGNIAATTISLRSGGQGLPTGTPQTTPTPTGTPGAISTPSRTPGMDSSGNFTGFSNGDAGRGTMGTLTNVNGNTLILTTMQNTQVTVTISDTTTIQKTIDGTAADLTTGESLVVMGSQNTDGSITARSISIQPQQ
jgi:hypothetical protein